MPTLSVGSHAVTQQAQSISVSPVVAVSIPEHTASADADSVALVSISHLAVGSFSPLSTSYPALRIRPVNILARIVKSFVNQVRSERIRLEIE